MLNGVRCRLLSLDRMGWRFRKSFKLFPGVKLNLSRGGLSLSLGGSPATLNIGPRGPRATLGVPGSGLSFSVPLGGQPAGRGGAHAPAPAAGIAPPAPAVPQAATSVDSSMHEIRSVSPDLMRGGSMDGFRQLLQEAQKEEAAIAAEVEALEPVTARSTRRAASWSRGWLFKRLFPKKAARIQQQAEEDAARLAELREQLELCRVRTEIEVPAELVEPYRQFIEAFRVLAGSAATWDTIAARSTDRVAERTTAGRTIDRKPVRFQMAKCRVIDFADPVPCLSNHNGGDLFLYPGFVLVHGNGGAFAVLDVREVRLDINEVQFQEAENVPPDAQVVGHTWLRANKDGSPDRRFNGNRQIPVARYGRLTVASGNGLCEEWMASNADAVLAFGRAWSALAASIQRAPA